MKYLFLCAMGENRSPTAASVAARMAREKGLDIEMSYGGIDFLLNSADINANKENLKKHFNQFDRIFVMEKYMEEGLEKKLDIEPRKIICMHIPDEYKRNDPVLVSILEGSLGVFI